MSDFYTEGRHTGNIYNLNPKIEWKNSCSFFMVAAMWRPK